MMNFTDHWHWPQWTVAIIMFLKVLIHVANSGKPRVDLEGEPFKYNGLLEIIHGVAMAFILAKGGFFP